MKKIIEIWLLIILAVTLLFAGIGFFEAQHLKSQSQIKPELEAAYGSAITTFIYVIGIIPRVVQGFCLALGIAGAHAVLYGVIYSLRRPKGSFIRGESYVKKT